ncbi:hypothetical protein CEXT_381061 [Caerostris extrusa]|uniref:Uncharacterized protein n=1 Tax=Caerostris extrusa TaxID=172846 RepID=A0AAV4SM82_CAEEX|nr:hypothetical protein CEXT_381061 [Caerostris extrusa]
MQILRYHSPINKQNSYLFQKQIQIAKLTVLKSFPKSIHPLLFLFEKPFPPGKKKMEVNTCLNNNYEMDSASAIKLAEMQRNFFPIKGWEKRMMMDRMNMIMMMMAGGVGRGTLWRCSHQCKYQLSFPLYSNHVSSILFRASENIRGIIA